jgi:F420-non-reducing hydrogenase small subunit
MVMPLSHVIDVDYIIPGCPPPPELIQEVFEMILENNLPDTGFIFGDSRALCDSCPRKGTLSRDLKVKEFRRLYEIELDPSRCFLDQSLLCLGPITRGGCGARCIGSNMPCRGCFGPLDSVVDTGLRIISFLSSLIESDDKEDIEKAVASIPDPRGMFYFYGMASSIWSRSRKGESG